MCANYLPEIEEFIQEYCLTGPNYKIPAKDLMDEINRTKRLNLNSTRSFPIVMNMYMERNKLVGKKKVGGITYYHGIMLKTIANDESYIETTPVQYEPEDIMMILCLQCESSQYDYMKKHNLIMRVYHPGTRDLDHSMTLQSTHRKVNEHIKFIIGNMKILIKGANTIANEYLRAQDQDIISSIILINPEYIPQYDENGALIIPIQRSELQFVFDRRLNMKETCRETLRTIKRLKTYQEILTSLLESNSLLNIPKLDPKVLSILEEGVKIDNQINNEYNREIKLEKETQQMLKNISLQASRGF